jgi:4-amino-4-deoxy-L-arabinose transferase-like glycosyltransferase
MQNNSTSTRSPQLRWIHLAVLGALLAAGAILRIHLIDKQSLWLDEYWAVYLATGREGGSVTGVFEAPRNVLLNSPISAGFNDAPAVWHIWNGLSSVVHPPLYYLVLRGWIDVFGDSDFSTRMLSSLLSLAAVAAIFEVLRRHRGVATGLLAAAFMSFAVCQIDYSQETRPYTLIALLTILAVGSVLEIETRGLARRRLAWLFAFVFLLALTHLLAAGGITALGLYALIRLRGPARKKTILILFGAVALFVLIWAPFMWSARHAILTATVFAPANTYKQIPYFLLIAPQRLFLGQFYQDNPPWPIIIFLAFLVYVMPLLNRRHSGDLLWWLWTVCSLGTIAILDWHAGSHRPPMLALDRYNLIVSPAVYALVAVPVASMIPARWLGAATLLICATNLEKPYDWLARSSSAMIQLYDRPWLPIILCFVLAIELAVILRIRGRPASRPWAWAWGIGAILFMIVFAAFEKKIPLDFPNVITLASVVAILGTTMPSVDDMRWLVPAVFAVCAAIDAGERFHNGPPAQPDTRSTALAVNRNVPQNEPLVFVGIGPDGPSFDYIAFSHYLPNSKRPVMLVDKPMSREQILALSGRQRIWIVGGSNGAEPVVASSRPGGG